MWKKTNFDMNTLITSAVSFVGSEIIYGMANEDKEVIGIDSINDYYDICMRFSQLRCCRQASLISVECLAKFVESIYQRIIQ